MTIWMLADNNKMVSLKGMKVVAQQSKAYNVENSDGTTIDNSNGEAVIGKVVYIIYDIRSN